jgi:hypothetical protein
MSIFPTFNIVQSHNVAEDISTINRTTAAMLHSAAVDSTQTGDVDLVQNPYNQFTTGFVPETLQGNFLPSNPSG